MSSHRILKRCVFKGWNLALIIFTASSKTLVSELSLKKTACDSEE